MTTISGTGGNDTRFGTSGDDVISLGSGNDKAYGRGGSDRISGGSGLDTLFGEAGNDSLDGGSGGDTLFGGDGRDLLVGGTGRDILFGGGGIDVFRFDDLDAGDVSAGPLSDAIRDFSSTDVIDLVQADLLYFAGWGVVEPARGGFGLWQASGNTYVSWNTFGEFHDIELTGFHGDAYSQIRWYVDDYDANSSTTGQIAAGQSRTGNLEVPEDSDWFRITLSADQIYTLNLQGASSGAGTTPNPYITLRNANGEAVAGADDGGVGPDARLSYYSHTTGTYYVDVDDSNNGAGTYRLSVSARAYVDDYRGDANTTGRIAVGQTREGDIGIAGDEDWFRINLVEGRTYTIDLKGQASGSGTLGDPFVELLDAQGNQLAADDDGSGSLDSRLIFTAATSGFHFISAEGLGDNTGTYDLTVRAGAVGAQTEELLLF